MFVRLPSPPPPSFIAGDEDGAVRADRDLHVADEGRRRRSRASARSRRRRRSEVTWSAPPPMAKLFQETYIAPVVRARGVVVDTARLAVVVAAVVRAGAGRPGDWPSAEVQTPIPWPPQPEARKTAIHFACSGRRRRPGRRSRCRGRCRTGRVFRGMKVAPLSSRVRAARVAGRRGPRVVEGRDDRVALGPGLGLGLGHVRGGALPPVISLTSVPPYGPGVEAGAAQRREVAPRRLRPCSVSRAAGSEDLRGVRVHLLLEAEPLDEAQTRLPRSCSRSRLLRARP